MGQLYCLRLETVMPLCELGMNEEVRDRIIQKMKELNLKQTDLIKALGLSKGTVSKWVSGTNIPSASVLPDLAKTLHTTPDWLINGGGMPLSNVLMHPVETWDDSTPLDDDEVEIPYFKDFGFACGSGSIGEALKNETRKLRMSKSTLRNLSIQKDNAISARAYGDSMNPTIKDGDTIHIDLGRKTIKDGKIFAICHGELFFAKRLYNLPLGGVRLVSDNSAEFPEVQLTAQEIIDQKFEVLGWIWQIASIETW